MIYFLDTDTCIYFLKGEQSVIDGLYSLSPEQVKIPSIVYAELIEGALSSARNLKVIENFCAAFEVIPFCKQSTTSYARIRQHLRVKGDMIGPNDLIIAATTITHHATLITHNTKEFKRVPDLKLRDFK